ncbi:hypothetical protein [Pseudovibrio denitrificans]|uniref:hypothetical protein n=1 Tax=Pseudovibrio denitrificans TaxID=258256 RepID=UPI000FFBE9DA|nr:hypothetical protein [Pseudovibrio denitrificans]
MADNYLGGIIGAKSIESCFDRVFIKLWVEGQMSNEREYTSRRWTYGLLILGAVMGLLGLTVLVFEPVQLLLTEFLKAQG